MSDCVHHWDIEAPEGLTVAGKCRKCEAVREWPNRLSVAPGRPMILHDPLMPRIYNNGYASPRTRNDYY